MSRLSGEKRFKVKLLYHNPSSQQLSLGVTQLSSYLRQNGHDVDEEIFNFKTNNKIINQVLRNRYLNKINNQILNDGLFSYSNFLLTKKIDKIIEKMKLKNYNIIGFSILSGNSILPSLALMNRIKQKYNIPIVIGGPYIRLFHDLLDLKKYRFIDYIIIDEGEISLSELIKYQKGESNDLSKIPSLKYLKGNGVYHNERHEFKINDSSIPYHQKELNPLLKKKNTNPISHPKDGIAYQLTKGCKYKCNFCSYFSIDKIQFKDIEKAIKEIRILKKNYEYNKFRFVDSNINMNKRYLEKFCDRVVEENLNIRWTGFARPDIKPNLLKKLSESGCENLHIGMESGSDKILSILNKKISRNTIERFLKDADHFGIKITPEIIIGVPGETNDDIKQTLSMLIRNKEYIHEVFMNHFRLIYGTNFYNHPEKFNIRIIGRISDINNEIFKFDEVDGLKWPEILTRTKKHFNLFKKALRNQNINFSYTHIDYSYSI